MSDRDRNLVRETLEALVALNKKIAECAHLGIKAEITARYAMDERGMPIAYHADFSRTETIMPS